MSDSEIHTIGNNFISDIKQILAVARQSAYTAVNTAMVQAYWQIGKRIVEQEQHGNERAAYGEAILKQLSIALTQDFGKGFSYANLRNFRQFYLTYPNPEICYALRSKLSWTHHRLIMRVENEAAREFYLKECEQQNWSSRALERNINTYYHQRIIANNAAGITKSQDQNNILDFIKDPYIFEFLNITQPHSHNETQIEAALIADLQQFLLELGKGFSFVARQQRLSTETQHFFIDLVFYNYILKCFVLFELKTHSLTHQDIGQIDMYVKMYDDFKRGTGDNPTIGILLCTDTDKTIAKYSVLDTSPQLFATKYMPYLPTEEELVNEIEKQKRLLALGGKEYE